MKNFFSKVKLWFINHKPSKRRLIQVYAALLYNANIKGFVTGRIYTGNTKVTCVPGLNCYSCPGATGACPMGALQNALGSSNQRAPYYVLGILALFCIIFARTICGFLCPVGLGQELLYKIKTPKLKKNKVTRILSYLKYVILVVLVFILPVLLHSPTFCKYICPAGTFGGGIGLLLHPENADFFAMLSGLFTWKFALLVAIIVLSIFAYRFFCRFLCPLGALYGLFNRIALLGVKLDPMKCTDCGLCLTHCKMDISRVGDHECIECGDCIAVCPTNAITWKGSKIFLHPNAVAAATAAEQPEPQASALGSLLVSGTTQTQTEAVVQTAETSPENAIEVVEVKEVKGAEKPVLSPALRVKRRNKWLEIAAWTVATLFLAFVLVYYNFLAPEDERQTVSGDVCPQFTAQGYNGVDNFSLADSAGKVVVINFWATWCPPCVAEIPHFNTLQENYADDVVVVALHGTLITTNPSNMDGVQNFINSQGWGDYSMTFLQDAEMSFTSDESGAVVTSDLYSYLGGKATWPMTVIVDREGKISYSRQGSMTYDALEKAVKPLI